MGKRRILAEELTLGTVLAWDAYDDRGRLLLRKGDVISSMNQVDVLVARGLFIENDPVRRPEFVRDKQGLSAVSPILEARYRLELICASDEPSDNFMTEIFGLRDLIAEACRLNQDVALATALFERDGRYSIRHAMDVGITCHVVGRALEMDEDVLTSTIAAALTMNISILHLQDELQSQKEALSPEQREIINRHPRESEALLRHRGVTDPIWLEAVLSHHEAIDGSGYGSGKKGDEVSVPAQLVSLGDVYCARISSRKYRRALRPNAALKALFLDQGKKVSPELAGLFIKAIGVFPAGTPVRLQNGEIAVVTACGDTARTPQVSSIVAPHGMPLVKPIKRDTRDPACAVCEVMEWSDVGAMPNMQTLWGKVAAAQ
jgi:HD-GYP domain-containing protein (c-di-GMP phosphodiesterase class II)